MTSPPCGLGNKRRPASCSYKVHLVISMYFFAHEALRSLFSARNYRTRRGANEINLLAKQVLQAEVVTFTVYSLQNYQYDENLGRYH